MGAGVSLGAMIGGRRRLLGTATSIALVALAAILIVTGGDAGGPPPGLPRLASAADLAEAEDVRGQPIYWAGERPPARIELSTEANGSVYVRYLLPGSADHLTVVTYRVAGAEAALRAAAIASEEEVVPITDGGVALAPEGSHSAYLVFSGSEQQVEVYDPVPGRAARLVRDGQIRPVGGG